MAFLNFTSTNPDFSRAISKNPSSPMFAKHIRKGIAYGYYDNPQSFNIMFKDDFDELSFSKTINSDFEYLDTTRYESPVFLFSCLREFFKSALNKPNEFDIPANHTINVPTMRVTRPKLIAKIAEHFSDYSIAIGEERGIIISAQNKTVYELLNYTYVMSLIIISAGHIQINSEINMLKRAIEAMNIINAPYFVRYMIKTLLIHEKKDFNTVKSSLENIPNHTVMMDYGNNQGARYFNISRFLIPDIDIVDFGAGEGNYTNIADRMPNNVYYAIERDDSVLEKLQRNIAKNERSNVAISKSIKEYFETRNDDNTMYNLIASEMIEHNDLKSVSKSLQKFYNDERCKRIIITTPNKTFNKHYMIEDGETRIEDHIQELSKQEFVDFINQIAPNATFVYVGDIVDGEPTTMMAVIDKNADRILGNGVSGEDFINGVVHQKKKKEEQATKPSIKEATTQQDTKQALSIDIQTHTIIFMIGPSGCGKTHFCKTKLIPALKNVSENANVQYISSDEMRTLLLGKDYDKYSQEMLSASHAAFELLYKRVETAMMFPVSAEYIIVDTKGIDAGFRNTILEMAKNNHYNFMPIIFHYKKMESYFTHAPSFMKRNITKDVKYIVSELRKSLSINGIKHHTVIRETDEDINITSTEYTELEKCFIPNTDVLCVSDIHGCYDEFVALLKQNNITVNDGYITDNKDDKLIAILGDYIDEGPQVEQCIDFCHKNMNRNDVRIVIGNHENRLYRELTEDLPHIMDEFFTSFTRLNDEYKQKFIEVYEHSLPFVRNASMIGTHAPCNAKYLGKIDKVSKRNQRYFPHTNSDATTIVDMLDSIKVFDDDIGTVTHVFGHIATSMPFAKHKRRMAIDGGCVEGYMLCGITIAHARKMEKTFIPSKQDQTKELIPFKDEITSDDTVYLPTPKEEQLAKNMAANGVMYLSGTMSPCDKYDGKLESIDSAIAYYRSHKVYNVVAQYKYMGSRCNVYLTHNNDTSYAISRRGYRIKIDLNNVYDVLRKRISETIPEWESMDMIVIDGELMPWAAIAQGLIKEFDDVSTDVKIECDWIDKTGFEQKLEELHKLYDDSGFHTKSANTTKKELIDEYGMANYATYSVFKMLGNQYIDTKKTRDMIRVYEEQVDLYGREGEVHYKPFAILKAIYNDGTEYIPALDDELKWNNENMFNALNPDGCFRFDISNDNDVKRLKELFTEITEVKKFEGIVIKPLELKSNSVPYLKVRNPHYLHIIYGFDYMDEHKYNKLYERKSVHTKQRLSRTEYNIGLRMLSIPRNQISFDNKEYRGCLYKMMREVEQENTIDPRL